jgi:DNA-binding LacI/PurR family transcriptional regulator
MKISNNSQIIAQISEQLKISKSSVYRVLSGRAGVRPEIRQIVIDELDRRSIVLQKKDGNERSIESKLVALIVGDVRNPYFAELTYQVQSEMNRNGYTVILFNSDYDEKRELSFFRLISEYKLAGLILMSAIQKSQLLVELAKINCPVVLLNRPVDGFKGSMVIIDNFQAGYVLTKHLIELGHQQIAFLAGSLNSTASASRLNGYRQAMANYSLSVFEEHIFYGDLKMSTGLAVGREYVNELDKLPRAIICGNDLMAIGFWQACQEAGVRIPEALSLAGMDNIVYSGLPYVELTTVEQPISEMGLKAVELLIDQIDEQLVKVDRVILEPRLVVRKSTGSPPKVPPLFL